MTMEEYGSQHRHIRDLLFQAVEAAVLEDYEKLEDLMSYLSVIVPTARANHRITTNVRAELDEESRCFSWEPKKRDDDS